MTKQKEICPRCHRPLRAINAWHYCKEVSIDDLFLKSSDSIILTFDRILEQIAEWKNLEISATKNCVVFVKNITFLVVKPMTKCLEVKFYSPDVIEDDDLFKCQLWNSKYQGIIRFKSEYELNTKHFEYFKKSYSIS